MTHNILAQSRKSHRFVALPVLVASALLSAACGMEVQSEGEGGKAKVNISSPFGSLSVKTAVNPEDTGLPTYPGARLVTKGGDDVSSANVVIGAPHFGLRLVAAELESDDAPASIVAFYKREMQQYGEVKECQGEWDMDGGPDADLPTCKPRAARTDLAAGVKGNHRIVSVKPRGNGSRFGIVHIQTGKGGTS